VSLGYQGLNKWAVVQTRLTITDLTYNNGSRTFAFDAAVDKSRTDHETRDFYSG